MTNIDVHNHVVPENFPVCPSPCCAPKWPSMQTNAQGKIAAFFGPKEFRVLDARSWSVERRLADMDEERIDIQALSPMPELLSYWLECEDASVVAGHVNRTISDIIAASPKRFVGLGMVALQDPQQAAKELSVLRDEMGLIGVEIGSNINGRPPGDAFFDPFFAEAERLGMAIFVHALHPVGTDRIVGPARLIPFVNFPVDVGFAALSMITGRTLEKFPNLRVGFSHGGGTLAAILPRLNQGWRGSPELRETCAEPAAMAGRFFYDNLVYDQPTLRHLIHSFGLSQLFIGTDYPYASRQTFPVAVVDELGLSASDHRAMAGDNAARFLALRPAA